MKKTVLILGIGTTPAVLTETVWALAHQKKPVVPDEVVVITTTKGRDALKEQILAGGGDSVWAKFVAALAKEKIPVKGKLCFGEASIRIMPNESRNHADDLRTGEDSLRAADCMLTELRAYTDPPDTTVLVSIAGGRKTMSALLFSCMTLVGRENDKVYHVLIPPEYECGMKPPFYFPQKGRSHEILDRNGPTGKKVKSEKIEIELFEIPFVRMRGWYQEKFKTQPPTYQTLVSKVQKELPPARTILPKLVIDADKGLFTVGDDTFKLSPTGFALLVMSIHGIHGVEKQYDMIMNLVKAKCDADKVPVWFSDFQSSERVNEHLHDDGSITMPEPPIVSKIANEARTALAKGGCDNMVIERLFPKRVKVVEDYPESRLEFRCKPPLADIFRCLKGPEA